MGNGIYGLCNDGSQNNQSSNLEWKTDGNKNKENNSVTMSKDSRKEKAEKLKELKLQFGNSVPTFGKFISDEEMKERTNPNVIEKEASLPKLTFKEKGKGLTMVSNDKENDCFEMQAILFRDDTIYKGSWNQNFKQHGYGEYVKPEGSKYIGFWEDGKISGLGRYIEKKGNYYEGK